jgi:Flp pilus assembly protein TadG
VRNRIVFLRREDGQALVELALVVPLLVILLFGIVDFGLALNQYNDTTNLANIGARAVAVASSTSTNPTCVSGTVTSSSLSGYLGCEGALDSSALGTLTVCSTDTSSPHTYAQGDTVQVKVDDTFNWMQIMFGGVGKLGGVVPSLQSTISSTATMREEANNTTTPSWVATGLASSC